MGSLYMIPSETFHTPKTHLDLLDLVVQLPYLVYKLPQLLHQGLTARVL